MKRKNLYNAVGLVVLLAWMAVELLAGAIPERATGHAALATLAVLLIFVVWTLVCAARLRLPPKLGLLCGVAAILRMALGFLPGGDGVVARAVTPEGMELAVTQEYDGEPYRVSFYARAPDGGQSRFYYEHEDTRWWRGLSRIRVAEDGRTATVYRTFWPVARYDIAAASFTLMRR